MVLTWFHMAVTLFMTAFEDFVFYICGNFEWILSMSLYIPFQKKSSSDQGVCFICTCIFLQVMEVN